MGSVSLRPRRSPPGVMAITHSAHSPAAPSLGARSV